MGSFSDQRHAKGKTIEGLEESSGEGSDGFLMQKKFLLGQDLNKNNSLTELNIFKNASKVKISCDLLKSLQTSTHTPWEKFTQIIKSLNTQENHFGIFPHRLIENYSRM